MKRYNNAKEGVFMKKKLLAAIIGATTLAMGVPVMAEDTIDLTLYFPVNVGGDAANLIDEMTAEYNEQNPDVNVTAVYTGNYDDTVTAIQTALQGGSDTKPDLFVSLATQRFTMDYTGMAMKLDDIIAADPDGQAFVDDFIDGFMLDSYVEDGSIISIPFQRSTEVLFYNKDAFAEVGLDPEAPPTTWDELAEYAVKLTNDNRYGVGIALNSGSAQWTFTGFSLQNCTNEVGLMNPNGKEVYFDTPENVEALQYWLDLQNEYKCMAPGIVQWTDLPTQFLSGEVAMIYHTTGNLANIKENADFDFGVAFQPANKQYGAPTGGGNFYITAGISEERQQAAWDYIKFMCSTENAVKWSMNTGYVATRNSCYETEELKEYYASYPAAKVAYEQLEYAQPELTTYNASEMWRILNDNIQAAVTGELTAEEAMAAAQQQADDVLYDFQ